MSDLGATGAVYDSPSEAIDKRSFVKLWIDTLALSEAEEKDWRKEAEEAGNIFAGKKGARNKAFNIFHSNIETLCPALYNSTPSPDVRRRFSDADPVGKIVADVLERGIEFSVDSYDLDSVMKEVVRDGEIAGRGVPRIRYEPLFGQPLLDGEGKQMLGEDGQPLRELLSQGVTSEYVPWRFFRRGPGRTWRDVAWVAFGDFLTIDALRQINPQCADDVPLNYTAGSENKRNQPNEQSIFRRALVWQIWDKDNRRVISLCTDYPDDVIAMVDDPLGLTDFFPVPRPYQPILVTDTLTPIVPYSIYEELVDELNQITKRITRLIKQLRPRALYAGQEINDINALAGADDGEMVPATGLDAFIGQGGGMDRLLAWWPLDPIVKALAQLVSQREMVKQTIYEVTGIADVLRGATNPQETLGAQQIKAQWGSLRIQDRQAEVQRVVRDLFRMKAEILATKFTWDMLSQMSGIRLLSQQEKQVLQQQAQMAQAALASQASVTPPQPGGLPPQQPPAPPQAPQSAAPAIPPDMQKLLTQPSQEDVQAVLQSDITRSYRIDVESDSTIRGDLTRNQQTMSMFLQGTAQFVSAMGPIIQADSAMIKPAIEVFSAFARQFKLGKQAEDALDSLSDSTDAAQTPAPKPDPKLELEKQKQEFDQNHQKMKFEADQAHQQTKLAMDKQQQDNDLMLQREKMNGEFALAREKHAKDLKVQSLTSGGPALDDNGQPIPDETANHVAAIAQGVQANTDAIQQLQLAFMHHAKTVEDTANAPVELLRGQDGRAVGVKRGNRVMQLHRGPDGRAIGLQ